MKTLIIIGFMASGKTTTGKRVSELTGLPFIDLDEEIERHAFKSINEIFKEMGEQGFRETEYKIFAKTIQNVNTGCIIASGGGLLTNSKNLDLIKKHCTCIFLDIPWLIIKARLKNDKKRPIIQGMKTIEIYRLWQNRRRIYLKHANYIIKVSKNNHEKK
jgi:shikimate kinase